MAGRTGTIVLCDGDLASLVCLTHAAEASASDQSVGADPAVVVVPVLAGDAARSAAVARQAAFFGAPLANTLDAASPDTDVLLAAGRYATEQQLARILWPAHAGVSGDPEAIDLDRAAAIANTAALVERLLDVEAATAPAIDAPFVDLCDRQLADLAIDLGLLPGDVWWTARAGDGQLLAAERWASAFEASGAPLRAAETGRAGTRRG